ncbi:hypothetical protein [Rhizobium laguerreae]|uniref:hypothetical protein n=1 Tax=Rhizobium laguerreae TaxID=1076926 RepID=UPI001C90925B|nr:hypothetical protein [Rhizobium laguerreae]MBY3568951.1 hypothetical protein [Rhizobium laguerreae]
MLDVHGGGSDAGGSYFEERARTVGSVLAVPMGEKLGEGLREAAFRATSRNAFRSTAIVVELSRAKSFRSVSSINEGAIEELNRLVEVLGIRKDAEHVRALLSNNGFAGKDWVRYFGFNIRRGHLAKERRVAPRSLRMVDCLEAVWSLRPLAFDLKTRESLLGHCPVCERSLGWRRTYGPSFCDRCPRADDPFRGGVDLRDFPQPLVDVTDDEAIEMVAGRLDPASLRSVSLHTDMEEWSGGEIFQLTVEIANRLEGNPAGWGKPLQARSIERAGRAILEWPDGLQELGDWFSEGDAANLEGGTDVFSRLQSNPKLTRRMRETLRRRSEHLIRRRVSVRIAGSPDAGQGGQPVRNCLTQLRRLTRGGSSISATEAAVLLLRASREARHTADALGLPLPFLVDLFEAGLMPELYPVLDGILTAPAAPSSLSLIEQLCTVGTRRPLAGNGMSLWSVSFASMGSNGPQWVEIFRKVCEGRFSLSQLPDPRGLTHQLHFDDVENLDLEPCLRDGSARTDKVTLTQGEIARIVGKSRRVVGHLVDAELLPVNATGGDLGRFREQWMFTSEACDLAVLRGRRDLGKIRAVLAASNAPTLSTATVTLWSRPSVIGILQRQTAS